MVVNSLVGVYRLREVKIIWTRISPPGSSDLICRLSLLWFLYFTGTCLITRMPSPKISYRDLLYICSADMGIEETRSFYKILSSFPNTHPSLGVSGFDPGANN